MMSKELIYLLLALAATGCGKHQETRSGIEAAGSYGYLDYSIRNYDQAYEQDPYGERVSTGGGQTDLFQICGTRDPGSRPMNLNCQSNNASSRSRQASTLVLHNTLEGLMDSANVFRNQRFLFRGESRNVSIHFLIGRDGTVLNMVPTNLAAYHAGSINDSTIGIELVANVANDVNRGHDKARTWDIGRRTPRLFSASGMTVPQYYSLLGKINDIILDRNNLIRSFSDIVSHRSTYPATKCPSAVWSTDRQFDQWRDSDLPSHMECYRRSSGNIDQFANCIGF